MKKVLAVLLAVIMLFSVLPLSSTAANDDEVVARMWICAEKSKNTGIWHVFLYFENLTDQPLKVGRYNTPAYDSVSVGCFGTEGPRGGGVYYNLESDLTHYGSLFGLSTELDRDELEAVNKKIKNHNYWDPIFNCYYFAARGWNAAADKKITYLIFPGIAKNLIRSKGGVSHPFNLFVDKPVYKQNEL